MQATRERLGQVSAEEITELPQGSSPTTPCAVKTLTFHHRVQGSRGTGRCPQECPHGPSQVCALSYHTYSVDIDIKSESPKSTRLRHTISASVSRTLPIGRSFTLGSPTQVQESIQELSYNISHTVSSFANTNLKVITH